MIVRGRKCGTLAMAAAATALISCSEPAPPPSEIAVAAPSPRLVVFVGEQLALEAPDDVPPESNGTRRIDEFGCYLDDPNYSARYRVIHAIAGEAAGEVEFESAPCLVREFGHSRWALLYVVMTEDGNWVVPGAAEAVFPTRDASWATCDADHMDEAKQSLLGPVEFLGDLVFGEAGWMSASGVANRFPADTYTISDGKAYCHRGLRLPSLVEVLDARLAAASDDPHWPYPDRLPPHR